MLVEAGKHPAFNVRQLQGYNRRPYQLRPYLLFLMRNMNKDCRQY